MGLILRSGTGTNQAEEVNLSSTTATATGVTTVDEAIAQLSQDVQNIQISSIPIEIEQNADFIISNLALYPVDCTAVPITTTPPSNPTIDDLFAVADARANSSINNITIDFAGAGQLLHGSLDIFVLNQDGGYAEFRYIGGEVGWISEK
ncbi:MAG: hypothetical protein QNJ41_12085 [Xenococcaceae cyanobacterium MO_188.B32]|nr:hypothetical protein [Xenococcaceae cyanobacterium MO_188.B32]